LLDPAFLPLPLERGFFFPFLLFFWRGRSLLSLYLPPPIILPLLWRGRIKVGEASSPSSGGGGLRWGRIIGGE